MTRLLALCFLLFLLSCRSYKMLEGRATPVTLIVDSVIYRPNGDTIGFSYYDLFGLNFRSISPQKGEKIQIPIIGEMLISGTSYFLVKPGEEIHISVDTNQNYTLAIKGDSKRTSELSFYSKFSREEFNAEIHNLNYYYALSDIEREKVLLERVRQERLIAKRLDSMIISENISSNAASIFRDQYFSARLSRIIQFYIDRKDSLIGIGLYKQKLKELLPIINKLTTINQVINGNALALTIFANTFLPVPETRLRNSKDLVSNLDSTIYYFNGISRDFILAKLLYLAINRRIEIPDYYIDYFKNNCFTREYLEIINKLLAEQQRNDRKSLLYDDAVFTFRRSKAYDLNSIIKANKGRVILLDFWASWCAPCISEIPFLKEMYKDYKAADLTIISVSLDRNVQAWRKYLLAHNLPTSMNYIFQNFDSSKMGKQYNIQSIPRYILINKSGEIVTDDAPRPSDIQLRKIIDELLY